MNKDEIKGKMEKIKGDVKERIGGATKDRETQAEGFVEEKKGAIREKIGQAEHEVEKDQEHERKEPEQP